MIITAPTFRNRNIVHGLPGVVGALLAACIALACLLSTASCADPSSDRSVRPSAEPPHSHPLLGVGTCKDDDAAGAPSRAERTPPPPPQATAPRPPSKPSAERCDALPDPDGVKLGNATVEAAAVFANL